MKIQLVFEAMADANRRKILDLLKTEDMSVSELGAHFEISGASLSHHLNKLKTAELVISKRNGQSIIYSIHTSVFEDVTKELAGLFNIKSKNQNKLPKEDLKQTDPKKKSSTKQRRTLKRRKT